MAGGDPLEQLGGHEGGGAGERDAREQQFAAVPDEAEVGELGLARRRQQDVGGLDVAVDQPRGVRRPEPEDDLADQGRGADRLEGPLADQRLLEAHAAGDVLHLDVVVTPVVPQVMDGHHVRMDQVGHGAGLGPESLADLRLLRHEAGVHHLDRARPPQAQVLAPVDPPHRPPADDLAEPVLAERPLGQVVDLREAVVLVDPGRSPGSATVTPIGWATVSSSGSSSPRRIRHGLVPSSMSEFEQMWVVDSCKIVPSQRGHRLVTVIIIVLSTRRDSRPHAGHSLILKCSQTAGSVKRTGPNWA